jgi:DNA-binding transcriptional regulator YdaS (Cro superfamily)
MGSVGAQVAFEILGGPAAVARRRGITPWAASQWLRRGVPGDQVLWLAEQTDYAVTPHAINAALYPHPADGLPEARRAQATTAAD